MHLKKTSIRHYVYNKFWTEFWLTLKDNILVLQWLYILHPIHTNSKRLNGALQIQCIFSYQYKYYKQDDGPAPSLLFLQLWRFFWKVGFFPQIFTTYNPDPIVCSALINKHVYTYSLKLLTISTFVILLVDQDGLVSSKDTR